jgi:MFS family permease
MKNPLVAYPSFRYYFVTRLAGTMANQMLMVVIAWQMYELTSSAYDLGLVGLVQFLPGLLLTLVAGHVADRYDRRVVLGMCMALQLAVTVPLLLGTLQGWVSRDVLLIASAVLGFVRAFQNPAQASLAPQLVPAEALPQAVATNASAQQLATIVGPALGGFLFVAGAHVVYAVATALFVIALAAVPMMRILLPSRGKPAIDMKSVLAGFAFVWRHKPILGAISLDLFAVLLGGAVALLPIFARDILHVGPWGLGLLRAAPAVGALLMSVYLAQHPITRNAGKIMFGAVALYGVSTLAFALSTSFVLSMVALALTGVFDVVSVVIRHSLVQLETPNELRGRVSAVSSIFTGASSQLGQYESGLTAAWFGAVPSVLIGGFGTILVVLAWMKIFPRLAERDALTSEEK